MIAKELVDLVKKTNYITPLRYISGRIVEYDISSANINILRSCNKISEECYTRLKNSPKLQREIEIGLMCKQDPSVTEIIKEGIVKAKINLIDANNVELSSIVRIANDAVYVNSSLDLPYRVFDGIEFKIKGKYSSMLRLPELLIFFWINNDGMNIDVKGIKQSEQALHAEYMLSLIAETMYLLERVSIKDALSFVSEKYDDYINLRLPVEFYRELNSRSSYKLKNTDFYLYQLDKDSVDINYNLYILRELWSIVLELYNVSIRRI